MADKYKYQFSKGFSDRLKKARDYRFRDSLNVSANTNLVHLTGLRRITIADYLTGVSTPGPDNLCILADVLDCSTDYLLGRISWEDEVDNAIDLSKPLLAFTALSVLVKNYLDEHEITEHPDGDRCSHCGRGCTTTKGKAINNHIDGCCFGEMREALQAIADAVRKAKGE